MTPAEYPELIASSRDCGGDNPAYEWITRDPACCIVVRAAIALTATNKTVKKRIRAIMMDMEPVFR